MGGAQQCTKQDSLYFGSAPVKKTMTQLCKLHLFSLSLGLVSENFSVSVSITVPSFPENWWHHWEEKKKKKEIHDIRLVPYDQKKMPETHIGIVTVEV